MNRRPSVYPWPVVPIIVMALSCVAITEMPAAHQGPCPHCHQPGVRDIAIRCSEDLHISDGGVIALTRRYRIWNWGIMGLALVLTIASAFTGAGGIYGIIFGVVLGLVSTAIGIFASTNVKEIEKTAF